MTGVAQVAESVRKTMSAKAASVVLFPTAPTEVAGARKPVGPVPWIAGLAAATANAKPSTMKPAEPVRRIAAVRAGRNARREPANSWLVTRRNAGATVAETVAEPAMTISTVLTVSANTSRGAVTKNATATRTAPRARPIAVSAVATVGATPATPKTVPPAPRTAGARPVATPVKRGSVCSRPATEANVAMTAVAGLVGCVTPLRTRFAMMARAIAPQRAVLQFAATAVAAIPAEPAQREPAMNLVSASSTGWFWSPPGHSGWDAMRL